VPLRPSGSRFCTDRAAKDLYGCKTGNIEGTRALGSALEASRRRLYAGRGARQHDRAELFMIATAVEGAGATAMRAPGRRLWRAPGRRRCGRRCDGCGGRRGGGDAGAGATAVEAAGAAAGEDRRVSRPS
ncbi:MAG: hypothetical protein PHC36_06105, partial [Eubacteriales bacterium]|nr:hypothetical protein [Eubacteriales bacterium]